MKLDKVVEMLEQSGFNVGLPITIMHEDKCRGVINGKPSELSECDCNAITAVLHLTKLVQEPKLDAHPTE